MQILQTQGAQIHWRQDGDPQGQPVMFANSLGTDLRIWDKVISLLPKNLAIIRFDKRGHGLSSCPPAPYSIDQLSADAAAILDHLNVKDCLFVGLSIGGMIGQSLAANRPDLVRALVLSNTAAKMGDLQMWQNRIDAVLANGVEAIADAVLERWFSPSFLLSEQATLCRNMLTQTPRQGYAGCCGAIAVADLTATTAKLNLPVLGIGGSHDLASPSSLVAATTALVSGSRFFEISNAGHLPCIESPTEHAKLLREFILEVCNERSV